MLKNARANKKAACNSYWAKFFRPLIIIIDESFQSFAQSEIM